MGKKFVITGFYGAGNTGDEAILQSIINILKKNYDDCEITTLTYSPEETAEKYGVTTIWRPNIGREIFNINWKSMIFAVKEADAVIIGGGGLFQDNHSFLTVPRYLQTAFLAQMLNTPTVIFSIGAGPIKSRVVKRQIKSVVGRSNNITTRDEYSKEVLQDAGIESTIKISADPVFSLSKDKRGHQIIDDLVDSNQTKRLGVSLRDYELEDGDKEELASFLDALSSDYEIIFIPFGEGGSEEVTDREVSEQVNSMMESDAHTIDKIHDPKVIMGMIDSMDFVIGMRLHSVIMAATANKSVLGISYKPKVESVLKRLGYKHNMYLTTDAGLNYDDLSIAYDNIIENEQVLQEYVKMSVKLFQEGVQQSLVDIKHQDIETTGKIAAGIEFLVTTTALGILELKRTRF
ncbi:polysaccharide pyruvyl transferase CsaB [Haladaptatus litoreus]|uniref:Polysaccharide pyruvyl transferase CsaB n=1 Tax=Haladaptatus litoreus TaxID=553468 RepID=A0A1N7DBJ8_9EURY|nr:polysaccharide pyruvyl transferase CsaB [Haladaptatus litoreus]SIR73228.1 polysaccharide pyruvyl transferase CsaB [Haladaptatus litoreus]